MPCVVCRVPCVAIPEKLDAVMLDEQQVPQDRVKHQLANSDTCQSTRGRACWNVQRPVSKVARHSNRATEQQSNRA